MLQTKSFVQSKVYLDLFTFETPRFQRQINQSHVEEIIKTISKYVISKLGSPLPPISVAQYQIDNGTFLSVNLKIIDGQHRYHAYKKLYADGNRFPVDIHVINCADQNEAEMFYQLFNKRLEHSEIQLKNPSNFSDIETEIHRWINDKSNAHIFGADRSQRPKIRISKLIDKFHLSSDKNSISSVEQFYQYLQMKNEEVKNQIMSNKELYIYGKSITPQMFNKAAELNWFLGLDNDLSWII